MSSHPLPAGSPPSLWQALAVQARVLGAVLMREIHTRYGRDNIGYLWLFGEPMMLASVIGIIHLSAGHTSAYGSDVQPMAFGVMSYTLFIIFRGIVNRSEGGLEANAALLYHRQVTIFDITIARAILEFAGVFTTYCILMVLLTAIGLAEPPARPLPFLCAWALMWWYALGHSFFITGVSYHNHLVGRFVHPYTYFMIALSGAYTPLGWVPPTLRHILQWVPMVNIFELARYGQFESFTLEYFDPQYLIGACMVLTWVGLVQMRRLRQRMHL